MASTPTCDELARLDTTDPADSVEFCPIEGFTKLLVCGTYKLHSEGSLNECTRQSRSGTLTLLQIKYCEQTETLELETVQCIGRDTLSGVFDIKWSPISISYQPTVAAACANGTLHVWTLQSEETRATLSALRLLGVNNETALCLSLDWNNRVSHQPTPKIGASYSDGRVAIWQLGGNDEQPSEAWKAHAAEVWIVAYDYWQSDVIYTGADDCKFRGWDTRVLPQPIFSKSFSMGVTSIQCNPHTTNIVAVGSYNESVSIWDTRHLTRPIESSILPKLQGGIWRLKWHPSNPGLMLAAAMHAGYYILSNEPTGLTKRAAYAGPHTSLAYGVDWCYDTHISSKAHRGVLVASCSFYDHMLSVWRYSDT